jgi:hypothetical protein
MVKRSFLEKAAEVGNLFFGGLFIMLLAGVYPSGQTNIGNLILSASC